MNNILINISYIVAIIVEICVPIILAVIIWKKFKVSWAIFFLGLGLFLASLIRIPLNNFVSGIIQGHFVGQKALLLTGLFASFAAGLFEEGVRVLGIGVIIKNRTYHKGLMYGIGHGGGGESMVFVGLSVLVNYVAFRFFPSVLPQSSINYLMSLQWYIPLLGALERLFAIIIQIALSVLIMNAFLKRKYIFILYAFILHVAIDFIAVYVNSRFNPFITEAVVFVFALISIFIIWILRPGKDKKLQTDSK